MLFTVLYENCSTVTCLCHNCEAQRHWAALICFFCVLMYSDVYPVSILDSQTSWYVCTICISVFWQQFCRLVDARATFVNTHCVVRTQWVCCWWTSVFVTDADWRCAADEQVCLWQMQIDDVLLMNKCVCDWCRLMKCCWWRHVFVTDADWWRAAAEGVCLWLMQIDDVLLMKACVCDWCRLTTCCWW